MPNEFQAREQGELKGNQITVALENGQTFFGWESVSVTKEIDSIANTFSITYDNHFDQQPGVLWPLRTGLKLRILLDEETILVGRTENLSASFGASSKSVTVSGRSLAGDLVDCTVVPKQFPDTTIDKIAGELIKPYGIKAFFSVTPGELKGFTTKPGETVFTALDRAARTLGFLWVSTREGNIRLTEASKFKGSSSISEDFNMLSGSIEIDDSERFRNYKVIGQAAKPKDQESETPGASSNPSATSSDLGARATRNLTVIAESNIDSAAAKKRASWEASNRIARGFSFSASMLGWKDEAGNIWGINQLVRVKSSLLGVNQELLTSSVSYTKSNSGTITSISLVRPDSYIAQPEFKSEADPSKIMGIDFDKYFPGKDT